MFGQIASVPSEGQKGVGILQIGEVRMSPQHAKMVAKVLQRQVDLYEKSIGLIPLPAD